MPLRVVELFVYPIKSARGIAVPRADVERRGLALDRRWMLVDECGIFISQRTFPQMALLEVEVKPDHLAVRAPGMGEVAVPLDGEGPRTRVTVFDDTCDAVLASADVSRWFAEAVGTPCRLVRMPDDVQRRVDPDFARADDLVSFADGFPFLLTSRASLEELNRRLDAPVPMDRFRPNLVVEGALAFAEDGWKRVQTSGVTFRVAKPCSRCAIPTVDQATGTRGVEPLRTLATFRTVKGGAMFGQNLLHDGLGTLHAGADLHVLE